MNELKFKNKCMLIAYSTMCVSMCAAYLGEYLEGTKELWYLLTVIALTIGPSAVTWIIYKIKNNISYLNYMIIVCYQFYYAFILLTSDTTSVFVYGVPMLIILVVYEDKLLTLISGSTTLIIYAVVSHFQLNGLVYGYSEKKIHYVTYVFCTFFCFAVNVTAKQLTQRKLRKIESEKEKTQNLLESLEAGRINISEKLNVVHNMLEDNDEQCSTSNSMLAEVQDASEKMAQNIFVQLELCTDIKEEIDKTTEISHKLSDEFKISKTNLTTNSKSVKDLEVSMEQSVQSNIEIENSMDSLIKTVNNAIAELKKISSITEQTKLLSFNARIEAARAGNSGKGFAVVAESISTLSEDTSSIVKLIDEAFAGISNETKNVGKNISTMSAINKNQEELFNVTIDSLNKVYESMEVMDTQMHFQYESMQNIQDKNRKIYNDISQLSAFSEELLSSTTQTKESSNKIITNSNQIESSVDEVIEILKNLS